MKKRTGYTLPEIAVAMSILVLVLAFLHGLVTQSARGAAQIGASEETVRSLSTGLEAIRRDVRRLVLLEPKQDLSVNPDGHGFSVRIPRRGTDFWAAQADVVTYSLGSGAKDARPLLRRDPDGQRAIGGCAIADLEVRLIKAGQASRYAGYLSVTLLGPRVPPGQLRLTASALLPLMRITTPLPFKA